MSTSARLSRSGELPEADERRRQYVRRFVASQGFDSSSLPEDCLLEIFRMLARVDEGELLQRCGPGEWSRQFLSTSRCAPALLPLIDVRLRELAEGGDLKTLQHSPPLWPDGKKFALVLTHDVDSLPGVRLMPRVRATKAIPSAPPLRKSLLALSAAKGVAMSLVPFCLTATTPFETWMEEEAKYGFRSSFFFFSTSPPIETWRDAFYRYSDRLPFDGAAEIAQRIETRAAERNFALRFSSEDIRAIGLTLFIQIMRDGGLRWQH